MSYQPHSREFDASVSASLQDHELALMLIRAGNLVVGDEGPRSAILGFAIAAIVGALIWTAIGAVVWSLW